MTIPKLTLEPIGVVHSNLIERADAPRQPGAGVAATGHIELYPQVGIEHAIEDLETFRHVWVLFWFHRNESWRPKVLPPRSEKRRGVFATRSPYRPNPIGLSVVRLLGIDGLRLELGEHDILDGSPVLDIKPYLPYADIVGDAGSGWLERTEPGLDPVGSNKVTFGPRAEQQLRFLVNEHGIELEPRVRATLAAGATPSAYRRIRRTDDGYVLAYKIWRFRYTLSDKHVTVHELSSGLKGNHLRSDQSPEANALRAMVERFGA
ncbi:MAG TPA: tRNA (N6-threonylcarbamoyladenosine(37)-N6)-methyltransferase TrmO [Polyangiaceae bacterium]|nr:tRNA (N6-threonylcarbamoyladenosine(37)-N6)-methyltransferase TrmO [Polyangiaceae bacterium]